MYILIIMFFTARVSMFLQNRQETLDRCASEHVLDLFITLTADKYILSCICFMAVVLWNIDTLTYHQLVPLN